MEAQKHLKTRTHRGPLKPNSVNDVRLKKLSLQTNANTGNQESLVIANSVRGTTYMNQSPLNMYYMNVQIRKSVLNLP